MFELVRTSRQQRKFEETWEYFCYKYGWCNDPYAENGVRYNLLLAKKNLFSPKKVIGTIEFIPYDPNNPNSTVEGPYKGNFSRIEEIGKNQSRVWEIDKLCISENFQRKGNFQSLLHIFHHHAKLHQPKYYIALIEKKFYRMLRISFGFSVEQKGEALKGQKTVLIPIVFNVEEIMKDSTKINKLLQQTIRSSK
ncbi:hypothetical protein ACLM5H_01700 [Fredinandcohnia humi]